MNDNTLLLRQIHPSFIHAGRVTSQAFTPTPKDDRQLSTYDGDHISPSAAFDHYTTQIKCQSIGVYAVRMDECLELQLEVRADPEPFPEHVVINFGERPPSAIRSVGKALRERAVARGWLHLGSQ